MICRDSSWRVVRKALALRTGIYQYRAILPHACIHAYAGAMICRDSSWRAVMEGAGIDLTSLAFASTVPLCPMLAIHA
jgi:hypothetical protein